MIAILYTDGQLNFHDLYKECRTEQWVPIFSIERNGEITIVGFDDLEVAHQFVKRNIDKNG